MCHLFSQTVTITASIEDEINVIEVQQPETDTSQFE